jgi:glycosyltransferase involved in cell wall biosynthesis
VNVCKLAGFDGMIDPRSPDFDFTPASPRRPTYSYGPVDPSAPPAATIITPFYNIGPIFHETARSVLSQSLQQFEWIIVNDASNKPEALAVLSQYRRLAETDPRIRVIDHEVNHGLAAARNTGFRAARTPYVLQLDGDDLIEPTKLEKCVWYLECNPGVAFVKGFSVGFGDEHYLWQKGFHDGRKFLQENLATATTVVRTSVHEAVGGYEESVRGGLEDWEFWVRCAAHGHWGQTIPEYLDWYRRRNNQHADWQNLASIERRKAFRRQLRSRYPGLSDGTFPRAERTYYAPNSNVRDDLPFENRLARGPGKRALVLLPWLRLGGADKFNLDLVRELTARGWEITIAATLEGHPWLPEFTRLTPDVFLLRHLAGPPDFARLLVYLITSRGVDVVLNTNSELGYLLTPYLRSRCPWPLYVDYNHMEEPEWKNGGHPRSGVGMQEQLDLNIVSSEHLKRWQVGRGADPGRVEVCTTNCNVSLWRRDPAARSLVRGTHDVPDSTPVILYAVRLCAQKQPMVFAETVRRLRDRGVRFVALVAGEGEDRPRLEQYLDRHGLRSCVRMLGPVATGDMPALMSAADVFFLPSKWEGIALSVYEAMAAGVCVVGADVGGQAELVTPQTGVLIDRGLSVEDQVGTYVHVLEDLLLHPEKARRMSEAARERIAHRFPLRAMGDRMEALFDHAAALRRRSPRVQLPRGLALELAVQGIEYVRVLELAEYLWPSHQKWIELEERQRQAQRRHEELQPALAGLQHIEGSRTWRFVQGVKGTLPYRILARARFGPDWDRPEPNPEARLRTILGSRSYRVIAGLKNNPPYRLYARVRYGNAFQRDIPEILRR